MAALPRPGSDVAMAVQFAWAVSQIPPAGLVLAVGPDVEVIEDAVLDPLAGHPGDPVTHVRGSLVASVVGRQVLLVPTYKQEPGRMMSRIGSAEPDLIYVVDPPCVPEAVIVVLWSRLRRPGARMLGVLHDGREVEFVRAGR